MSIDTACSSSLVALDRAFRDMQNGTIDRAIVAGISLTTNPNASASFNAYNMLSPTGRCHAFDDRADGYCRSDGVACIVLERNSNGYAYIGGTGTNSDGHTSHGTSYPFESLFSTSFLIFALHRCNKQVSPIQALNSRLL